MRQAGYTLLEMLVVAAILATLAALVVPGMVGRTDGVLRARALADMQTIAGGLHLFRIDVGRLPTTEEGLDALREPATAGRIPTGRNPHGYLDEVPVDPWGMPYAYVATSEHSYRLLSRGADGAPGGTGADADLELEQ